MPAERAGVVVISDSSSEDEAVEIYEAQEICLTLPAEHCRLLQSLVEDHKQFLPVGAAPHFCPTFSSCHNRDIFYLRCLFYGPVAKSLWSA